MRSAQTAAAVAARVRRLAVTLRDLKERVRRAVATEAGKAVADAVRDVLTTVLAAPVVLADPCPPYRPRPATAGPIADLGTTSVMTTSKMTTNSTSVMTNRSRPYPWPRPRYGRPSPG